MKKYKRGRSIRELILDFVLKIAWMLSVDATERFVTMGEYYGEKVPEELKDVRITSHEFLTIRHDEKRRKEIIAWLEREE